MGEHHTNNQAEYAGLIGGLQAALDMGCRSIKVQGDSTLIIRQARLRCRCGGGGGGGGGGLHLPAGFGNLVPLCCSMHACLKLFKH